MQLKSPTRIAVPPRASSGIFFANSFAADVAETTAATADHGGPFSAALQAGNFCGVQFHPEKSGPVGARLLRNFLAL